MIPEMGFTRAEQASSRWEQKRIRQNAVINLMNPQKLNYTIGGDLVGFIEHLYSKPLSYNCYVHCARISSMGGTQKLPINVERT